MFEFSTKFISQTNIINHREKIYIESRLLKILNYEIETMYSYLLYMYVINIEYCIR